MAYQPGDTLVRAVMEASTGLPTDRVVNDFAFTFPGIPVGGDLDLVVGAVDNFYNDGATGPDRLSWYLSAWISRAATHHLEFYNIVDGPLGSPFHIRPWLGPANPGFTPSFFPPECAAVLSFHADMVDVAEFGPPEAIPSTDAAIDQGAPATHVGTPRPKARRRGRLYVGPLNNGAFNEDQPACPLAPAFTLALRRAGSELKVALGTGGNGWGVWSRRDKVVRRVTGGWTDDAPDIQRRRGITPTTRALWT